MATAASFSLFLPPRQHSSPYYSSLFCETVLSAPVVYTYPGLMMMMFTLLECIFSLFFTGKGRRQYVNWGDISFFPGGQRGGGKEAISFGAGQRDLHIKKKDLGGIHGEG